MKKIGFSIIKRVYQGEKTHSSKEIRMKSSPIFMKLLEEMHLIRNQKISQVNLLQSQIEKIKQFLTLSGENNLSSGLKMVDLVS